MEITPCLSAIENYRRLFEADHQMHCGPVALFIEKSACVKALCTESSVRMHGECCKLYKVPSNERKFFKIKM